jgi:hypothetical protein
VSERASEDMIAGQRGEVPVGRWGNENFAAFQKAQMWECDMYLYTFLVME